MHVAVGRGRLDLALALLDRGAAINAVNQVNVWWYRLGCEITSYIVDLINKYVRWVFIVVIQDGWTVLHVAVDGAIQRHRADLVHLLLSRGASIDITNKVAFFFKYPVQYSTSMHLQ